MAAVSEEDKAIARRLHMALGGSLYTEHNIDTIAAEFARIRAEERESCARVAASFRCHWCGDNGAAAAIRSRGEGDANEKG